MAGFLGVEGPYHARQFGSPTCPILWLATEGRWHLILPPEGCLCCCKGTLKRLGGCGWWGRSLALVPTGPVRAVLIALKRLGSLLAIVALLERMRLVVPTIAMKEAKGRMRLAWGHGEPQRLVGDPTLIEALNR